MSGNNFITERLIGEFAENYTEKLFYFCLKKTGNSYEAEDLASDIILNILSALDKGTIPTSFSAWIWQIAHNRYSVWADKKHKYTESVIGSDVEAYEIEDENANIENELIHSEDIVAAPKRAGIYFVRLSEHRRRLLYRRQKNKGDRRLSRSSGRHG